MYWTVIFVVGRVESGTGKNVRTVPVPDLGARFSPESSGLKIRNTIFIYLLFILAGSDPE